MMPTLKEFLYELAEELRFLPAKQVNEVLKHYRDKVNVEVDYGTPEEKVLAEMPSPKEIAKNIYEMHGVDYLSKRQKRVKIKNIFNMIIYSLAFLACLIIFIVGTVFVGSVLINMITLVASVFHFTQILDIIISFLFTISYFLIMLIIYVYILDLFIILFNSLFGKILDCMDKTRGKTFGFMNFTINGSLNKVTKKKNVIAKTFGIIFIAFCLTGITSYFTKGRVYRSINDINTQKATYVIEENIKNIKIDGINAYVILKVDQNIKQIQIDNEYEFSHIEYNVVNDVLEIKIKQNKTYDFLGLLKSPLPIVRVVLPISYQIDNVNIDLSYGKIVFDQVNNISSITKIKTTSANISLNKNHFMGEVNIESYSSDIISKDNTFELYKLNQLSGTLTMENDIINIFDHQNGSSKVQLINSKLKDYNLNNQSGSIYLERVTGEKINFITATSQNELYDIYFDTGKFQIRSTASFKITRSIFNTSVEIESNSSSHQAISYMSSPLITLKGSTGQILCEYINGIYSDEKINKNFDDDYKQYVLAYNKLVVENNFETLLDIKATNTNVSLSETKAKELKLEIVNAATAILNLDIETSTIILNDTGAKIKNFYGENINFTLKSSGKISRQTTVSFINEKTSNLKVQVKSDAMSYVSEHENIELEYVK